MRFQLLSLCIVAALVAGNHAWAQQGRDRDQVDRVAPREQRGMDRDSLSDSVRKVARDTRGQVLGAERVSFDGREVHRVKVLDERGRVRVYMDDPQQSRGMQRDPRGPGRTRDDDD